MKNPTLSAIVALLQPIATKRQEHFVCITLNAKHKVIDTHTVFIGSATASLVHPREVLLHALDDHAAAIIVAHNHPSGDETPSDDDITVTRQLASAAQIMDIPLLDHIIVAGERYLSFKEEGVLVEPSVIGDQVKADVAEKFNKLYIPLLNLITALDVIEPGGTLAEDVRLHGEYGNKVRLEFVARPMMLTIKEEHRKMVLRVMESEG